MSGPVTYWEASSACRHTGAVRERHDALSERNSLARATATLKARGEFDPARHGAADVAPLSLAEHLELLATGAVVAHYYRHPASVHHAALAGASWEQIAAALAITQEQARRDYREWAEGQYRLWQREGRWGLGDAEYAAAMARTGPAAVEPGQPAMSGGDEDQAAVILSALEDAAAAGQPGGRGPRPPRELEGGTSGAHHCRIPACPVAIAPGRLMCRTHWYQVPKALRDRVWATWQSGAGAFRPEYRQAVRDAVHAVEDAAAGKAAQR